MTPTEPPIHDSATLRVTRTLGDPARAAEAVDIVTFEPWRARTQPQPFGRSFAAKYGLNALHVLPVGDDWYQYDDLEQALAAVARHVGPRTLGYGSSMGGYAVTSYGDLAGLRRALALSPQFTIHRESVPFERRWAADAARIAFRPDHARVAPGVEITVLFDPENADGEHARLIAAAAPGRVTLVRVPGGGHPVNPVLVEAGLLSRLVLSLVQGDRLATETEAEIAGAVVRSPRHHFARAFQTSDDAREAHLREGLALAPPGCPHAPWLGAPSLAVGPAGRGAGRASLGLRAPPGASGLCAPVAEPRNPPGASRGDGTTGPLPPGPGRTALAAGFAVA